MSQHYWLSIYVLIYLFIIQQSPTECRRRFQRIVINGHDWTVPNQPGWDALLRGAEPIQKQLLSKCTSSRECRLAAEELRQIFMKQQISPTYSNDLRRKNPSENEGSSIFKWG